MDKKSKPNKLIEFKINLNNKEKKINNYLNSGYNIDDYSEEEFEDNKCIRCGRYGHYSNDCTFLTDINSNIIIDDSSEDSDYSSDDSYEY